METMDQKQKFNNVLWELFRLYRGAKEREGLRGVTLLDFSNAIPIPATTRSSLMPDHGPSAYIPSDAMLDKIARFAERFGKSDDVYEAAGRSPRMPSDVLTRQFIKVLGSIKNEDKKRELLEELKRMAAEEAERDEEMPRQLQLA